MAITPRILFTQPASAAVAAVTLFGMTIFATNVIHELRTEETSRLMASPCADLSADLGPQSMWSEAAWLRYAHCFDMHEDSASTVSVAREGLQAYPLSESLHNVAGYHLIELGAYRDAARTLERGLHLVGPTSDGVMENNLAWTYLWLGVGSSERARDLYLDSLDKAPTVCETLHTGLMVEFERARGSVGLERAEALKSYQTLRTRYGACEHRETTWENLVETTGAGVLDVEIERMLETGFRLDQSNDTLRIASNRLDSDYGSALSAALCARAIPMSDLRDECVRAINDAR